MWLRKGEPPLPLAAVPARCSAHLQHQASTCLPASGGLLSGFAALPAAPVCSRRRGLAGRVHCSLTTTPTTKPFRPQSPGMPHADTRHVPHQPWPAHPSRLLYQWLMPPHTQPCHLTCVGLRGAGPAVGPEAVGARVQPHHPRAVHPHGRAGPHHPAPHPAAGSRHQVRGGVMLRPIPLLATDTR